MSWVFQCLQYDQSLVQQLYNSHAKEGSKDMAGGPQKEEEETQTPPFTLGQKGGAFFPLPYSLKGL